jgi:hypothetical protein
MGVLNTYIASAIRRKNIPQVTAIMVIPKRLLDEKRAIHMAEQALRKII